MASPELPTRELLRAEKLLEGKEKIPKFSNLQEVIDFTGQVLQGDLDEIRRRMPLEGLPVEINI